MLSAMVPNFLAHHRWDEKLENWKRGVQDDGSNWCLGCNTMFFSTDKLGEHILNHHSVTKMFRHHFENDDTKPETKQCDQCSSSFGTIWELTRHLKSVHYQERIECPDCSETFTRKDNFKLHQKNNHKVTHHDVRIEQFKCEICGYSFSRKSALKRHTQDTCNVEKKVFVVSCDCCEATFIRTSNLKKHQQKRENPDGSAKFSCTICDKKMCNMKLLKTHIKNEHTQIEKYSDPSDGKQSEATETFQCEFCDKQFAREDTLLKHKVTHTTVEKIECENCGRKFTLRQNYVRHKKEALGEDGSPQHVCPICKKDFCTWKSMSGHMNACHNNYSCPLCNQTFTLKKNLERHVGKRMAVTCKDCGKVFCNSKSYSEHIETLHRKSV